MKFLMTLLLLMSALTINAQEVDSLINEVRSLALDDGTRILTDTAGLSLYTFDVDPDGESACFDSCLVAWPPLTTEAESLLEPFGIHIRADGTKQVMLDNRPLYFFISDKNPGDIRGDGIGGVWHLITL